MQRILRFAKDLAGIYFGKRVSRSAAELSYFLTLSVFPTLMCLYALVGEFIPSSGMVEEVLRGVLPPDTIRTIENYLLYVSVFSGKRMLTAGAILMATSSAAAFRSLHNIMADIQGAPHYQGLRSVIASFVFSLVFLAAMYFTVIVIVSGEWLLKLLDEHIPVSWEWSWLRFVLLYAILLLILLGVYRLTSPRGTPAPILPGALAAALCMVAAGMASSAMVSMSVRYSLVYGSLASLVILMLWLYVFGNILIMGNALNFLIGERRGQERC